MLLTDYLTTRAPAVQHEMLVDFQEHGYPIDVHAASSTDFAMLVRASAFALTRFFLRARSCTPPPEHAARALGRANLCPRPEHNCKIVIHNNSQLKNFSLLILLDVLFSVIYMHAPPSHSEAITAQQSILKGIETALMSLRIGGLIVRFASDNDIKVLRDDLSASDLYELGMTWRKNWKAEFEATFKAASCSIAVEIPGHEGILIFGVTSWTGGLGQIWMLQSETFTKSVKTFANIGLHMRLHSGIQLAMNVFLQTHSPLFNFIPKNQLNNIRWLKACGFEFRSDPFHTGQPLLLFGMGQGFEKLAASKQFWSLLH
ncbi:hypothetical protein [Cupriavidus necator]